MASAEVNVPVEIGLGLTEGSPTYLHEAAKAVRTEYQASVRWKKLRCRNVISLPSSGGVDIKVYSPARGFASDLMNTIYGISAKL
jgi:hypothetical protein